MTRQSTPGAGVSLGEVPDAFIVPVPDALGATVHATATLETKSRPPTIDRHLSMGFTSHSPHYGYNARKARLSSVRGVQ